MWYNRIMLWHKPRLINSFQTVYRQEGTVAYLCKRRSNPLCSRTVSRWAIRCFLSFPGEISSDYRFREWIPVNSSPPKEEVSSLLSTVYSWLPVYSSYIHTKVIAVVKLVFLSMVSHNTLALVVDSADELILCDRNVLPSDMIGNEEYMWGDRPAERNRLQ